MALKERVADFTLVFAVVLCLGLLASVLKTMLFHIVCGIVFMGCAAFTLVRGQEATTRRARLGWFVCTGAVALSRLVGHST